ncbi:putative deacetoxyvindoline 4-hydroxylase [Helianthus annuus]|nr:putative deacetoxyvindoline 4-hydroxylase [Helianthus annuus]
MKLGVCLFELMSEALRLDANHLLDMGCADGLAVLGHYYPSCPQPELTIGTVAHTDNSFITILLQDHIGGLKIFYKNQWTDVPPIPGALVVNAGDFLQVSLHSLMISGKSRRNIKGYLKNISVYCGGFRKKKSAYTTEKIFYLHFTKKVEGYPEHPVNPLDPSLLMIVVKNYHE